MIISVFFYFYIKEKKRMKKKNQPDTKSSLIPPNTYIHTSHIEKKTDCINTNMCICMYISSYSNFKSILSLANICHPQATLFFLIFLYIFFISKLKNPVSCEISHSIHIYMFYIRDEKRLVLLKKIFILPIHSKTASKKKIENLLN